MLEELIVQYAAPTLAGLKTGSLFNVPCESERRLENDVKSLNRRLKKKNLRLYLMKIIRGRALLYLVQLQKLKADLSCAKAKKILSERGYRCDRVGMCIERFYEKLNADEDFPHEAGLFLGFPVDDVIGFLENRPCIFAGAWKVYGNCEQALKIFESFRQCTEEMKNSFSDGVPLEELAVAI